MTNDSERRFLERRLREVNSQLNSHAIERAAKAGEHHDSPLCRADAIRVRPRGCCGGGNLESIKVLSQ
ncbi:MAG: hypothetical protein DMF98_26270 [Acidobacteria bacterium]|nr:MAG: hypothetical protein DMF98_26270 [Acidobacteriota bacterium]